MWVTTELHQRTNSRIYLYTLSSLVPFHKKPIIFPPLCSWNASPAALARGSAGVRPSDATARPTQPVHLCSHQSDLNVDKKDSDKDSWNRNSKFKSFGHCIFLTPPFLLSLNTRIKRSYSALSLAQRDTKSKVTDNKNIHAHQDTQTCIQMQRRTHVSMFDPFCLTGSPRLSCKHNEMVHHYCTALSQVSKHEAPGWYSVHNYSKGGTCTLTDWWETIFSIYSNCNFGVQWDQFEGTFYILILV